MTAKSISFRRYFFRFVFLHYLFLYSQPRVRFDELELAAGGRPVPISRFGCCCCCCCFSIFFLVFKDKFPPRVLKRETEREIGKKKLPSQLRAQRDMNQVQSKRPLLAAAPPAPRPRAGVLLGFTGFYWVRPFLGPVRSLSAHLTDVLAGYALFFYRFYRIFFLSFFLNFFYILFGIDCFIFRLSFAFCCVFFYGILPGFTGFCWV